MQCYLDAKLHYVASTYMCYDNKVDLISMTLYVISCKLQLYCSSYIWKIQRERSRQTDRAIKREGHGERGCGGTRSLRMSDIFKVRQFISSAPFEM